MRGVRERLDEILSEKTCVVGIGNPLRGDDAVGPLVAEGLLAGEGPPEGISVVNAEDVLESHLFPVAESDAPNVLLIDAVRLEGAAPGSLVLGRLEELECADDGCSTHKLPLSAAAEVFASHGKKTFLLGIVGANTDFGTEIAEGARESAEIVALWIRSARSR